MLMIDLRVLTATWYERSDCIYSKCIKCICL